MKYTFNLSDKKRQIFFDYFRSELRATKQHSPSGQTRHLSNGCIATSIIIPFQLKDDQKVTLNWTFNIDSNGNLTDVEVISIDLAIEEDVWRETVRKFIEAVLDSVFEGTRKQYFRRNLFCYIGAPLDGEYWLPGHPKFRFAPLDPSENDGTSGFERIVCFDMEIDAIDERHASLIADEKTRTLASRLSLFLGHDLYSPSHIPIQHMWVIPFDHEKPPPEESRRYQRGLFFKTPTLPTTLPKKGELCNAGTFTGLFWEEESFTPGVLKLPQNTREILTSIHNAGPQFEDAFDRCARLYHVSLANQERFPSVALAYKIAALEALARKTEGYKDFKEFINQSFDKESKKFIDSVCVDGRHKHLHAGSFPMGEYEYESVGEPIIDRSFFEKIDLYQKVGFVTRNIIENILKRIVENHYSKE
ncbi:MAG: hypothetical protein VST70_04940 [Nitrospirota bacterium]|nr:hypothetical protein [Nitrospirota bacterium]